MKKILTLLALVSSSICFASSDGNLPVNNATESVASASVAPIADFAAMDLSVFDNDRSVCSKTKTRELPLCMSSLSIKVDARGNPFELKWTNDGEIYSSAFAEHFGGYEDDCANRLELPVISTSEQGNWLYLDGRTPNREMTRKIDELFISYEPNFVMREEALTCDVREKAHRSFMIYTDSEPGNKLLVDRIIMNNIDSLDIFNMNDGKVRINHIEMRGNSNHLLNLTDDHVAVTYRGGSLSNGLYTVDPNGNLTLVS